MEKYNDIDIIQEELNEFFRTVRDTADVKESEDVKYEHLLGQGEYVWIYLLNKDEKYREDVEKLIEHEVECELDRNEEECAVYLLTFLLSKTKKSKYIKKLLRLVINSNKLERDTKLFLYNQIERYTFIFNDVKNKDIQDLKSQLYTEIFCEFKKAVGSYNFIEKEHRNEDLILVFSTQILGLNHAPTLIALEKSHVLIENMKKKVILIDTSEIMPQKGFTIVHNFFYPNKEIYGNRIFQYKDKKIPFYQCSSEMPDIKEYIKILNLVNKYKPYMIFCVGDKSIISDLCSQIVPTANISLSSDLPETRGTFRIVYNNIDEEQYKRLSKYNSHKESIIISDKEFCFLDQTKKLCRQQFGIPETGFVVGIIGNRLDIEVDEEFLNLLNNLAFKGCFTVFIGQFMNIEEKLKNYSKLKSNYKYIGYQDDLLSALELLDIYINPERQGGGTSAIMSMYKGIPVISLKYGDVAHNIGEEFCVNNYEEMKFVIEKYKNDKIFYQTVSNKIKEKAAQLTNNESFKRCYNEIINSNLFK